MVRDAATICFDSCFSSPMSYTVFFDSRTSSPKSHTVLFDSRTSSPKSYSENIGMVQKINSFSSVRRTDISVEKMIETGIRRDEKLFGV